MLKPLNDNVIIKKTKVKNQTASGIILSSKQEEDDIAVVVAVGAGSIVDGKLIPIDLKVNDRVIYKKYSTTEVKYQDEEYYIVAAKDILAKVEE